MKTWLKWALYFSITSVILNSLIYLIVGNQGENSLSFLGGIGLLINIIAVIILTPFYLITNTYPTDTFMNTIISTLIAFFILGAIIGLIVQKINSKNPQITKFKNKKGVRK